MNMHFKVLSEPIEPPIDRRRRGRPLGGGASYPFADLVAGSNKPFLAPRDMGKNGEGRDSRQTSIGAAANAWAKRHAPGAKFIVRIIDDNTVGCWRIK